MGQIEDLTGQRFGKLVVVERYGSVDNRASWKCKCDCGGWRIVCGRYLRNGSAVDCGCSKAVIDEQGEIWKPVVGYEHQYEVSNHGRVKSCKRYRKGKKGAPTLVRERLLVQTVDHSGYMKVGLSADNHSKNHSVHRLVGEAFIPNPHGLEQINHKDENKKNNHVSNLEWCTNEYNSTYGTRLDRIAKKNASSPKFKKPIVGVRGKEVVRFDSARSASRALGICASQITAVCRGREKTAGGFIWEYAPRKEQA